MAYWFCLEHNDVEPESGCGHAHRLGPYDSQSDATAALERAKARSEAWEDDSRWNDRQDDED